MILVDVNILLYAQDSLSPRHEQAKQWWDACLSGSAPVCLCWPVLTAFIRIATNRRVFERPLTVDEAIAQVQSWLEQPCVRLVQPIDSHWQILQQMLQAGQAVGGLVPDAHLAALAVEHGCQLCSTDTDFARFPRLKWKNPLEC